MATTASTSSTPPRASYWLALLAGIAGAVLAGAVALWIFYGGAVFQAMIAAGIAWCL